MPLATRLRVLARAFALLALAAGSFWITRGSVGYFDPEELHPFVVERLPELPALHMPEGLWLHALSVHVASAAFALPMCLALWSRTVLRRWPRLHRWLGRSCGVVVLLGLVPSGAVLAFAAKGGLVSTAGFLASGAIMLVGMVQAVRHARGRAFDAHRRASAHVLAQMSVAVTSRALLIGLDRLEVDEQLAYLVGLWLPVAASFVAVEVLFPRRSSASVGTSKGARPMVTRPAFASSFVSSLVSSISSLFAALFAVALLLPSGPARAEEPAPTLEQTVQKVVEKQLLTSLREKENKRSKYSRMRMPPAQRRVRLLDEAAVQDADGRSLASFAIEEKYFREDDWRETYRGCMYLADESVFLKTGDTFRPAAFLLGKKVEPTTTVCTPAPVTTAAVAPAPQPYSADHLR